MLSEGERSESGERVSEANDELTVNTPSERAKYSPCTVKALLTLLR